MVKKKPDRFERIVQDWVQDAAGFCKIVDPSDAARMLHQYHREVVELVKKELAEAIAEKRMDSFELLIKKLKEFTK